MATSDPELKAPLRRKKAEDQMIMAEKKVDSYDTSVM